MTTIQYINARIKALSHMAKVNDKLGISNTEGAIILELKKIKQMVKHGL